MKMTKKLISALLAVVMVVTMLPFTAFAATTKSADDKVALDAMEAIQEYERKMGEGKVWKNMKAAYDAYINVVKSYNVYVYGDYDNNLQGYVNTLVSTTEAMVDTNIYDWSTYTGITSVTPTFNGGNVTSGFYGNLVAADTCTTDYASKTTSGDVSGRSVQFTTYANANINLFQPNVVAVYDGKNDLIVPVMAGLLVDKRSTKRRVYTIYPTAQTGYPISNDRNASNKTRPANHPFFLSLYKTKNNDSYNFKGAENQNSMNFNDARGKGSLMGSTQANEGEHYSDEMGYSLGGWWGYYATAFQVTNDIDFGTTSQGYMNLKPYWAYFGDSGTSNANNSNYFDSNLYDIKQTSKSIHILNVKGLLDIYPTAIANAKYYATHISHYRNDTEGASLSEFFEGMDYITSLGISDITGATTSTASSVGERITKAIQKTAKTGVALESTGYAALRKAMEDSRSTYNSVAYDRYTPTSWQNFKDAYEAGQLFMRNSMTAGYKNTEAQQLADALKKDDTETGRYYELEVNFTPANVTALIAVMDEAIFAAKNKDLFTDSSYPSDLDDLINDCKADIWEYYYDDVNEVQVDGYKDPASVCASSRQSDVNDWVDVFNQKLATLVIDPDAAVLTAQGYSMNGAVDKSDDYNAADYVNYGDVLDAVANAERFDARVVGPTTDTSNGMAGLVQAKVNEYNSLTEEIIIAINSLRVAFSRMPDGTIVSAMNSEQGLATFDLGSDKSREMNFAYIYPNNVVLFRTTHDAKVVTLGSAAIGFYANASKNKMGPSYLDSINIDSNVLGDTGEITSNYDDRDHSMSSPGDYPGNLQKTVNVNGTNYTYYLGYNADYPGSGIYGNAMTSVNYFGRDMDGNNVTSTTYDWTDALKNTSGKSAGTTGPVGSIIADHGWTLLLASTSIRIPGKSSFRPSITTIPIASDSKVSALARWNADGAANRVYYGYTANSVTYSQTAYVIDIAGLIDLMNEADAKQSVDYTIDSWTPFVTARTQAKDDILYNELDAVGIYNECQSRYTALSDAIEDLDYAAKNDRIDEALESAAQVIEDVNNGTRYSPASYQEFLNLRQAALDAVNGDYSDANCRNIERDLLYGTVNGQQLSNQAYIDSIGDALLDFIANGLVSFADFSPIDNAIANAVIADRTYSTATLEELNNYVANLPYAGMTQAQREEVFDEPLVKNAISKEATNITSKINKLVAGTKAQNTEFKAACTFVADADPDAYTTASVQAANAYVNEYMADNYDKFYYEPMTVLGKTVLAIRSQTSADAVTATALSKLASQSYAVFVDGVQYGGTDNYYTFGDEAEIEFGKTCAIYYAYTSNTATNAAKYYTTDRRIRFVVKGTTNLTTKAAVNDTTVKVNYVNGLKNKTYGTDYVAKNGVVTLQDAPSVAFYEFINYTVNGVNYNVGDQVTITKATSVIANYEYATEDEFDVQIYLAKSGVGDLAPFGITPNYNERVDITQAGLEHYSKIEGSNKYEGATVKVNGKDVIQTGSKSSVEYKNNSDAIYAYAMVDYEDYDDFDDIYGRFIIEDKFTNEISYSEDCADYEGIMSVVSYGPNYSFYASGSSVIIALTAEEFEHCTNANLIKTDTNGADVTLKKDLVDADTKWSVVGTYALPAGATLVENGILFTKNNSTLRMSAVDGTNVYRFKSSQHTVGNQYVISIKKPSRNTSVNYVGYTIYELNGVQYTVFSDTLFDKTLTPKA